MLDQTASLSCAHLYEFWKHMGAHIRTADIWKQTFTQLGVFIFVDRHFGANIHSDKRLRTTIYNRGHWGANVYSDRNLGANRHATLGNKNQCTTHPHQNVGFPFLSVFMFKCYHFTYILMKLLNFASMV